MPVVERRAREFKLLKMAALLREPPWSWWVSTGRLSGDLSCARVEGCGDGASLLVKLLGLSVGEAVRLAEREERVREAWEYSAPFVEWALPGERGEPRAYANPFAPQFQVGGEYLEPPEASVVCRYVELLSSAVSDALKRGGLGLAYHVAYSLLEPLWFHVAGPRVPLGSSKLPTFTLFDRAYAAAAAVNWYARGRGPEGALARINVVGVERWVGYAREPAEGLAAGWLVSAAVWYTVRPLVEALGADVLLHPSLRLNPFYVAWLRAELGRVGASAALSVVDEVLLRRFELRRSVDTLPRYPTVPGEATLILPPLEWVRDVVGVERLGTPEGLEGWLRERFAEAWRLVMEELLPALRRMLGGLPVRVEEYISALASKPPMQVRVGVVEVSFDSREFERFADDAIAAVEGRVAECRPEVDGREACIEAFKLARKLKRDPKRKPIFFHWALGELAARLASATGVEVVTGAQAAAAVRRYSAALAEEGGLAVCSDCGTVVAVEARVTDALAEAKPEAVGRGERLCPYCLARRLVAVGELPVGRLVHDSLSGEALPVRVPPASVLEELDALHKLSRIIGGEARATNIDGLDIVAGPALEKLMKLGWARLGELLEAARRGDEAVAGKLADVLGVDAGRVAEALRGVGRGLYVVAANSDWASMVSRGYCSRDPRGYWEAVARAGSPVKPRAMELFVAGVEEALARRPRRATEEPPATLDCGGVAARVNPLRLTTLVSLTYAVAYGYAETLTSLLDAAAIVMHGGVPLYVGGGDFLAVLPGFSGAVAAWLRGTLGRGECLEAPCPARPNPKAWESRIAFATPATGFAWLDAVAATRRLWWGLDSGEPGFHTVGYKEVLMLAPALAATGRRYAASPARPVRDAVEAARRLLAAAGDVYARLGREAVRVKDSLAAGAASLLRLATTPPAQPADAVELTGRSVGSALWLAGLAARGELPPRALEALLSRLREAEKLLPDFDALEEWIRRVLVEAGAREPVASEVAGELALLERANLDAALLKLECRRCSVASRLAFAEAARLALHLTHSFTRSA